MRENTAIHANSGYDIFENALVGILSMNLSRKIRLAILVALLLGTVGCDQTVKHLARVHLGESTAVPLPGGFGELRLAENAGAFLSLGASLPPAVRTWVFTIGTAVGLLALAGYLLGRACFSRLTFVGAALVLAGGASNLIDRIARDGFVTDFITLRCGPLHTGVFNLADMFVLLGVSLIFLAQWRTPPPIAGGQQP